MIWTLFIFLVIFGHNLVENNELTIDVKLRTNGSVVGTDDKNIGFEGNPKNGSQINEHINCTIPAIVNFPYISSNFRKSLFMSFLALFIITYLFIGTALICDEYFVPSLEVICDKFKLESDIAGSTFMAAGSSAPELATTLIGVFVAKDDIGVGAVVGSAVFNIAFVISICALFAGRVVHINWWPIIRDTFFYLISICILFIAMFDEKISLIESIAFLAVYFIYILFMKYNKQIRDKFCHTFAISTTNCGESSDFVTYKTLAENETLNETVNACDVDCIDVNTLQYHTNQSCDHLHESLDKCQPNEGSLPQTKAKQIWQSFISPLNLIHWLTLPNCRNEKFKNLFALTFVVSCIWISIYTYIIVWMITIIGFNLQIPDTVMGLVFIAFGASIPDAIASLIVVRQGLVDMALTNAIASNVFDILVCLGLPWFLKTAIIDPGSHVDVISRGLEYSTVSLLATVIFFLVITHLNGWKLSVKYGIILMIWYIVFISMASLYELNVFGSLNPVVCFTDF